MDLITPAEVYVSKLKIDKTDKHVYIKLIWKRNDNDLFHIQVFDGDCSWSGRYSNEFAQNIRKRDNINENEETYATNVKKSICGEDENYTYEFKPDVNDKDTATFIWKRKFEKIAVVHGKVPVHRDENIEPKTVLVDILLKKNFDLKNELNRHHAQSTKIVSELDKSKHDIEKYMNMKTSLETTLYGKFVQLLNAKKRRIRDLEDNLLNFEEPNNISMSSELD